MNRFIGFHADSGERLVVAALGVPEKRVSMLGAAMALLMFSAGCRASQSRHDVRDRVEFTYQGDLAIRKAEPGHLRLITGKIDVRGSRLPNGSCTLNERDMPWVNPRYGLYPELGEVNLETCQAVVWVIDPNIRRYGPMRSDTTVRRTAR